MLLVQSAILKLKTQDLEEFIICFLDQEVTIKNVKQLHNHLYFRTLHMSETLVHFDNRISITMCNMSYGNSPSRQFTDIVKLFSLKKNLNT